MKENRLIFMGGGGAPGAAPGSAPKKTPEEMQQKIDKVVELAQARDKAKEALDAAERDMNKIKKREEILEDMKKTGQESIIVGKKEMTPQQLSEDTERLQKETESNITEKRAEYEKAKAEYDAAYGGLPKAAQNKFNNMMKELEESEEPEETKGLIKKLLDMIKDILAMLTEAGLIEKNPMDKKAEKGKNAPEDHGIPPTPGGVKREVATKGIKQTKEDIEKSKKEYTEAADTDKYKNAEARIKMIDSIAENLERSGTQVKTGMDLAKSKLDKLPKTDEINIVRKALDNINVKRVADKLTLALSAKAGYRVDEWSEVQAVATAQGMSPDAFNLDASGKLEYPTQFMANLNTLIGKIS